MGDLAIVILSFSHWQCPAMCLAVSPRSVHGVLQLGNGASLWSMNSSRSSDGAGFKSRYN